MNTTTQSPGLCRGDEKNGESTAPRTDTPQPRTEPMLSVNNLRVVYGGATEAVRDVSFEIPKGRIVALLGANGAGKSTVLKAISGILDSEDGRIEKGEIRFAGIDTTHADAARIVAQGLIHIPEGRRLFASMTVDENLTAGGHHSPADQLSSRRSRVYDLFPALRSLRRRTAGYLSGGEQQMVAIGRALMGNPTLLAFDEPSLGLAPLIVSEIFDHVRHLCDQEGMTILLVEQNANKALAIADFGYIMENGRVVLDGTAADLRSNPDVREFYLGLGGGDQIASMRDIKHYKRRKRWLS